MVCRQIQRGEQFLAGQRAQGYLEALSMALAVQIEAYLRAGILDVNVFGGGCECFMGRDLLCTQAQQKR